ncbi:HAD family hydrolase [Bartonella sp. B10834G6]|uniref:HAD family hydrolase n=1 Tax=Bartonella apis TaxID=1686310 RepID=UPI0018DDC877|nr:HAD family hydrolase [Bartonella apis]MBH9982237.1 HAD family hydrolase [Bartonella apis]
MSIKTVGLDADDTLWHNEKLFREAEQNFVQLLGHCADKEIIESTLFLTIARNLGLYGYGFKSFTLSMIETASHVYNEAIPSSKMKEIISLGQSLMDKPVNLIDGVVEVLEALHKNYRLLLISKGDLVEQGRKLEKSRLKSYFDAIEIVSHKDKTVYEELLKRNRVNMNEFVMVGNSLKSDILPALEAGAYAIYIPYDITWVHEMADEPDDNGRYFKVEKLSDLPELLKIINRKS